MIDQAHHTHSFRQWGERRLAEIEATLASLETEAAELKAELRADADHAIAALKHQRDTLRAMVDELESEAASAAHIRRAQLEDALAQVKEIAEAADAQMDRLAEAGRQSWAALRAALVESRHAFDHAVQKVWDALKSATSDKT